MENILEKEEKFYLIVSYSTYEGNSGKKITTYVVIADSVEFGEAKASSGSTDTGHSASKSTNNVMETPTFEETSSDDTGTSAEIDDEFPF